MKEYSGKKWEIGHKSTDDEKVFCKELGISPLTARLLQNRGIVTLEEAKHFLSPALADLPDPFLMEGMKKAVTRIISAILAKERITIYGDYDVDGITATALLFLFFREAEAFVDFWLPLRLEEGYGLNLAMIQKIKAQGTQLLITVDCGISNRDEVLWAQNNGLDVVITDHHEVPEEIPPAFAVLDPKQKRCRYPFKGLAGVGVAFNLALAIRSRLRQCGYWKRSGGPNLKEYLDLVALGTVSDVVPLIGTNRILTKFGLAQITRSARAGILALKEIAGLAERPVDTPEIHFRLAPRINAPGRLGDAHEAVRLFISRDTAEARRIAQHLDELNAERQQIEAKTLAEARRMIGCFLAEGERKSFVLASADWHPGVIGIVAGRLAEEYQRPTILIALAKGMGKGSGRSLDSFSIYQGLQFCQNWIEKFGGHEQAAGLVIRPEQVAGFAQAFEEIVKSCSPGSEAGPILFIDSMARLHQLDEQFLGDLESLAPFGVGNPEPVIGIEDISVLGSKLVGKGHIRFLIRDDGLTREAIGFGLAARPPILQERMKMALIPQSNFFRGKRTLQFKVIDLQPITMTP